jgi:hypothetical protein
MVAMLLAKALAPNESATAATAEVNKVRGFKELANETGESNFIMYRLFVVVYRAIFTVTAFNYARRRGECKRKMQESAFFIHRLFTAFKGNRPVFARGLARMLRWRRWLEQNLRFTISDLRVATAAAALATEQRPRQRL